MGVCTIAWKFSFFRAIDNLGRLWVSSLFSGQFTNIVQLVEVQILYQSSFFKQICWSGTSTSIQKRPSAPTTQSGTPVAAKNCRSHREYGYSCSEHLRGIFASSHRCLMTQLNHCSLKIKRLIWLDIWFSRKHPLQKGVVGVSFELSTFQVRPELVYHAHHGQTLPFLECAA